MPVEQHQHGIRQRPVKILGWSLMLLVLVAAAGCYNGEALVDQARIIAAHGMREEFDLGKYYVTLPRQVGKSTTVSLELHIFTSVPAADVPILEEEFEKNKQRLRHETILTLRQAAPKELADPALASLRERVANVAIHALTATPVDEIGFYSFAVQEQ